MVERQLLVPSVFLSVFSLIMACDSPEDPGCDICTSSAIVYGTVTSAEGTEVSGAEVEVVGWRLGCPSEGGRGPITLQPQDPPLQTNGDGFYRGVVAGLGLSPQDMCLGVRAIPPEDSGLMASADTGASVMLTSDSERNESRDSVGVDLVLPTSP